MKKYLFVSALIIAAVFTGCKDTDNSNPGKTEKETCEISFDQNGGEGGQTENVTATFGQPMPALTASAPTREEHNFNGYYDAETGGTRYYKTDLSSAQNWNKKEDATLYARWTPTGSGGGETYTLSFDANGGEGGQTAELTATYGEAMPALAGTVPTYTGYIFNGYFDAQTGGTKYYNADLSSAQNWDKKEDATLYAQWTPLQPNGPHTLSFDVNGGTGGQTASVTAMPGQAMPALSAQPPTKIENIPTTQFTYRGSDFNVGGNSYTTNTTYNLDRPYNGFNKEYYFDGYFDAQTGGTKYYNDDLTSAKNWDKQADTKLYARWLSPEEKYPLSFGSNPLDPFDYTAHFTDTAPVIDGKGDDAVWEKAQWKPIDQVWMRNKGNAPVNFDPPDPAAFSGRYKILWTAEKLYYLVEITDAVRSVRPNYTWSTNPENSDCLELFFNEDGTGPTSRSGNNFFTYHMEFSFAEGQKHAGDYAGGWQDRGSHLNYMITQDGNTYTWEIEMTVYNSSYNDTTGGTPVTLTEGKKMGLAVAYCDANTNPATNTQTRDNFFGSMFIKGTTADQRNQGYRNAAVYAKLYLVK